MENPQRPPPAETTTRKFPRVSRWEGIGVNRIYLNPTSRTLRRMPEHRSAPTPNLTKERTREKDSLPSHHARRYTDSPFAFRSLPKQPGSRNARTRVRTNDEERRIRLALAIAGAERSRRKETAWKKRKAPGGKALFLVPHQLVGVRDRLFKRGEGFPNVGVYLGPDGSVVESSDLRSLGLRQKL